MSIGLKTRLFLARRRLERAQNWRDYHLEHMQLHEHRAALYHEEACDAQDQIAALETKLRAQRLGAMA